MFTRRSFIKGSFAGSAAIGLGLVTTNQLFASAPSKLPFKISLAQWSLHRSLFDGKIAPLDFPEKSRKLFNIDAVEYVSTFYKDLVHSASFASELKQRANDAGVKSLLIMVDGEGDLGAPDKGERVKTVENHKKWVHAAAELNCHSIRVNAAGPGTREELAEAVIDGLQMLAEYSKPFGISVLVENHGGFSSDANWLSNVMTRVSMPNCGTLPDFGNFCIHKAGETCTEFFDRYKGVELLMPWAKAISAKSYDFYNSGEEISMDYRRLLRIVMDFNYSGYVGVEYEGDRMSEIEGVKATIHLLESIRESL